MPDSTSSTTNEPATSSDSSSTLSASATLPQQLLDSCMELVFSGRNISGTAPNGDACSWELPPCLNLENAGEQGLFSSGAERGVLACLVLVAVAAAGTALYYRNQAQAGRRAVAAERYDGGESTINPAFERPGTGGQSRVDVSNEALQTLDENDPRPRWSSGAANTSPDTQRGGRT